MGFFIAAILVLALVAAGAGFTLYQRKGNRDTAGFFAPRSRRLAFVERTALEGGRKLLLVRRDDVEHLILVGGPVDVVIETGIRVEASASADMKEAAAVEARFRPPLLSFTRSHLPIRFAPPRLQRWRSRT